MELSSEALETIGNYVRRHLTLWLHEVTPPGYTERDIELRERTVRVEEELKAQRELMRQGFEQMEKRFEQVDRRFEQVDKRFEDMNQHMNRWFSVLTVMVGIMAVATTVGLFVR